VHGRARLQKGKNYRGYEEIKKNNRKEKISAVMDEFKHGELISGSGKKVTNRKQAVAIALSEARDAGADIPKNPRSGASS
jgi:Family of unknown function (DUF6496)